MKTKILISLGFLLALTFCKTGNRNRNLPTFQLTELFDHFSKKEILDPKNLTLCPKVGCGKSHKETSKKMELYKVPPILALHLKRGDAHGKKQNNLVNFPLTDLDLTSYVLRNDQNPIYDLIAVINHHGKSITGGHYTAYIKDHISSKWYHLDDSSATELSDTGTVVSDQAYILFYRKKSEASTVTDPIPFRGLTNIRNTCYMNSALQVFLHIPEYKPYFEKQSYKKHIKTKTENFHGTGGEVADAYAELLKAYMTAGTDPLPEPTMKKFKTEFVKHGTLFNDNEQHDSKGFWDTLFEYLAEDLYRKTTKQTYTKDDLGQTDEDLAKIFWAGEQQRNQSFLFRHFTGQYKGETKVEEGPHKGERSRQFETFTSLTLHLPKK